MADVTGTLHEEYAGKTYRLRLTMLVMSELQMVHGDGFHRRLEATEEKLPDFGLMVDVVERSLVRGGDAPAGEARLIADDMLTADPTILGRLMQSAFPDAYAAKAAAGNVQPAAKTAKAG